MLSIPNLLTISRILLIPVFVLAFYWPTESSKMIAALIFMLAGFTDWLDGFLARKMGQVSALGAFLDPVADKLMVATTLILLVEANPEPAMAIPAAIIIGREITISALREWMASLGARAQVAVSEIGKIKTAVQMLAILLLIYDTDIAGMSIQLVGYVLLYVAVVLTLWSMTIYLRAAWPELMASRNK